MSRGVTRIQSFTRVTELADDDVIVIGPASGDRAKGITKENLEKQFEGDGSPVIKQVFTSNGVINSNTRLAISTGDNTLILPDTNTAILNIKSISGTITLDPGSRTIENGNSISTTVNRIFNLEGAVWLEL